MNFSDIYKRAAFLVCVPTCLCCKTRLSIKEDVFCEKCRELYDNQKDRYCSRCKNRLDSCSCSTFFLEKRYVRRLTKLFRYIKDEDNYAGNSIIYSLKRDNRRDVVNFAANEIAKSIEDCCLIRNKGDIVITNIPRRKKAIRENGFDHTKVLAKKIASILDVEYIHIMNSNSKGEQKLSKNTAERFKNLNYVLTKRATSLKGKTVFLIDDVVTTGASMSSAAKLLHSLGAKKIFGSCLGIAYKDSYVPFEENK